MLSVTPDSQGIGNAIDNTTTYTVLSNTHASNFLKIVGSITGGGSMPPYTELLINLISNKGISKGEQILSTSSVDLVIKIPSFMSDTGSIIYNFKVLNGTKIQSQVLTRIVTLTLLSTG